MIERLEGRLAKKLGTMLHLQCGPLWLELQAPLSTCEVLPGEGSAVVLWTHLQWKEDGPTLFGFATQEERSLFRLLLQVQGVGPRIALSLLAHFPPAELVDRLRRRDEESLTRVPGVGAKTAGRLIVDLAQKADKLAPALVATVPGATRDEFSPVVEDAIQALTALGYPARDARRAAEEAARSLPEAALDELLRLALRQVTGAARRR